MMLQRNDIKEQRKVWDCNFFYLLKIQLQKFYSIMKNNLPICTKRIEYQKSGLQMESQNERDVCTVVNAQQKVKNLQL